MSVWVVPSVLTAGASVFLATIILRKQKEGLHFFSFLWLMAVMAWIHGLNGFQEVFPEHLLFWKKLILLGEITLPVMIGYIGYSLLKKFSSNPMAFGSGWWKMIASGAALLALLIMSIPDVFMQANRDGGIVFKKPEGLMVWGFIILASCIGLFQLERMLRAFPDPLRYRLKYVLLGLGGLACISIVQAIHMVVASVWRPNPMWAGGMASLSSLLLMAVGLRRWRIPQVNQKIQISHHALYASLVVLCIGGYLVLVAMLAVGIQQTDWEVKESLGVFFIFLAVLGLMVVMLSRGVRVEFRQIVSRHFFKAKYDYREKWLEVTETFSTCRDAQQILDWYLEWLSRTFGTSRVTIWKYFSVDGRYHQIRKERRRRNLLESDRSSFPLDPLPIPETHPLIQQLKAQPSPLFVQAGNYDSESWGDFLHDTRALVCVPLLTEQRRLLGFCMLSQDMAEEGYDQDDCDLLRVIAHHMTMLLIQFELIEERSSAAKWEAVHRFSAFYLHDLKNLASSLSLVAQNASQYGSDLEFQASAMKTVKDTSQKIIGLMGELSRQTKELNVSVGVAAEDVDVNQLIRDTLATVDVSECQASFNPGSGVPILRLKKEAIKQVLLNLILNARQASGEKGAIQLSTAYDGERVIVELVDTGRGMSEFQLEKIFQPFQSSKKNGLGVGLFQCKRIVEDHHGVIHIESREGVGTKVIVIFPVEMSDKTGIAVSDVSQAGVRHAPSRNV